MPRFTAISMSVACAVVSLALMASRPAAASPLMNHRVSNVEAMHAYVEAIRYFNPSIDEPEAEHIVVAIIRETYSAGVDPRLVVAIVATESSFDRTARSSAGAMVWVS